MGRIGEIPVLFPSKDLKSLSQHFFFLKKKRKAEYYQVFILQLSQVQTLATTNDGSAELEKKTNIFSPLQGPNIFKPSHREFSAKGRLFNSRLSNCRKINSITDPSLLGSKCHWLPNTAQQSKRSLTYVNATLLFQNICINLIDGMICHLYV